MSATNENLPRNGVKEKAREVNRFAMRWISSAVLIFCLALFIVANLGASIG